MTSDPTGLPHRASVRTRLAIGLTVSTLLVAALVAVAATVLAAWQSDPDAVSPQAGAARVADDVTVVIVTDDGAEAAAAGARSATLRWSLVALALSVIPAIGVAWFAAGRMLRSVDQALDEVAAADEDRQQRLQEVVHELRTPLAVMSTNLELAATAPDLDTEAGGFVDAARRAAARMGRTVDDLAGHGRLAVNANSGWVDLSALIGEVAAEHAGPARTAGLHLTITNAAPVAIRDADQSALRTIVSNLVGNAVRLAPRGSAVRLDSGTTGTWAWATVADEGPGLPFGLHARVFERGWRGRHERDRGDDHDRAGLGLTIARQLAEAQGGQLTIESEEGVGTTFALWIPLDSAAAVEDVVQPDGVHPATRPWLRDSFVS